MSLRDALDRTLLLMRDEIEESVPDETMLAALTGTRIALIADGKNLVSHSAQTAFVAAALLMARSGHAVHLFAPDVVMRGAQRPLGAGGIITELMKVGKDMLPGVEFSLATPTDQFDLILAFGDTETTLSAQRSVRLNATDWSGSLTRESVPWPASDWPLGGLTAATLATGEAFKCAIHKLASGAKNPRRMDTVFAPTDEVQYLLAPEDTPKSAAVGAFDCISGGAIIHAVLYILSRLPGLSGYVRVIEPDTADLSNMNRYALLLRSMLASPKADHLAQLFAGSGLEIDGVNLRYDPTDRATLRLAPAVLVGVDDIPTRWEVQRARPEWLAVGATTHWCAMASFHEAGLGCAECAHPYDDPGAGPIPTVSFVSFWAGLLVASYYLRRMAGRAATVDQQQIFLPAFRTENAVRSIVHIRPDCLSCSTKTDPAFGVSCMAG
jgi:hypothetical protein